VPLKNNMPNLSKSTPPPWKWVGTEGAPEKRCYLYGPEFAMIGYLPHADSLSDADAELIVAAPTLAKKISDANKVLDKPDYTNPEELVRKLREILSNV
jgi:hypothetical protein